MAHQLCPYSSPFDFSVPCVRSAWASFAPAALVFLICIFSARLPLSPTLKKIADSVKVPFTPFITLQEAEAINAAAATPAPAAWEGAPAADKPPAALWRTVLLAWLALLEALLWLALAAFRLVSTPKDVWAAALPALLAGAWLYAAARPALRPPRTVQYDLFAVYCVQLVCAVLLLGGVLLDNVAGVPLPGPVALVGLAANLAAVLLLLVIAGSMPLAIPSRSIKKDQIGVSVSPEDYTSLFGWLTFHWVYPLVQRGKNTTLNENDVWNLSPTMQCRPVFTQFMSTKRGKLLGQMWRANSLDLIFDFVGTMVSVVANYMSPFFLKRILDVIGDPAPEARAAAYVYALLAFVCTLVKAEADLQHLWYGRRAATRVRSELMAAIYDKALKRVDYSGIVDKDKLDTKDGKDAKDAKDTKDGKDGRSAKDRAQDAKDKKKEEREIARRADDPQAGADIGKIVNLMAGDCSRISNILSGMYFLYGSPLEIIIASIFLFQLLGWSAFAGFAVVLVGWPLNSVIARRGIRIQKGVLAARDKRMGVLNELIGSIKFIKFFAWEDRWIARALDARQYEMKWMLKGRINYALFSCLWLFAPILVSIVSFFAYVVQGNELSVSTAFTAIALYNMMRAPLNTIPTWIVQLLQTKVSVDRIATYLDEEEVGAQVSALKQDAGADGAEGEAAGLGAEGAWFRWNELPEKTADGAKGKGKGADATKKSSASNGGAADGAAPPREVSEADTVVAEDAEADGARAPAARFFELRDISVRFPEGKLTCVTGPTASGKTALLMALLGEMTLARGRLVMAKRPARVDAHGLAHALAYAAQTPWLRHQSIRENILFGSAYEEARYAAVVECCALRPDLEMLEDGDETEIGARGVSLSGGQKARVALARAVYARTKYVLLDDPLSAVDSHTARFLFERLFCGPLLAHRTVILVTHHVELVLPGAYYLVRMLDGRIDTQGTVEELRAQGVLEAIKNVENVEVAKEEMQLATEEAAPADDVLEDTAAAVANAAVEEAEEAEAGPAKKPKKLITEEHRETGGVKWKIYKTYLKASSYWTWSILFVIVMTQQMLGVGEKIWIKIWGEAYEESTQAAALRVFSSFATAEHEGPPDAHVLAQPLRDAFARLQLAPAALPALLPAIQLPSAQEHPLFYIGIYAFIGMAAASFTVTSVVVQFTGALRASKILFERLLKRVVRATMRWHDVTPQGRMLNRFGKDIETIDMSLAGSLQAVNSSLASFFASAITVVVIFPLFIVPATVIGFGYRFLAIGYLRTGRDLRRMESNTRSPIFSGFSELLEGIVTVRAFSAERRFADDLHGKIDLTTKMWYSFWMTNRWLLLNFDALGGLAVLCTTLFAVAGFVSAGIAGLCITSAMTFTTNVYWACRFWTALELDLNSVERVVEYLDLPQEPPAVIESNRPPAYWPSGSQGKPLVVVEDLVVKYAPDLPPVLHGVSFSINAKERVGILGRTGSGKSTLAMSILRFVDPVSGRIIIDGIDTSTIGIHDLRSRLTFIPQDAALFSGSLRDNLDPFKEYEDNECLDVLYRVQMLSESAYQSQKNSREPSRAPSIHHGEEDTVSSVAPTVVDGDVKSNISLETKVSSGGANFSQGQRQLIAMARALLRRSSIIILDEATSSIDFETDTKIQATIREEFGQSLLLTVAHRIRTIIDYDRLLILDKGQVVEFDTPYNLIRKENGVFRGMCMKSGTFGELEAAAKAKAEESAH